MPEGSGEWRLYNVVTDPGEAKDLSTALPEKLETLKVAWEQYAADVGVVLGE
jgi:arylsulfatase A-like enzyme